MRFLRLRPAVLGLVLLITALVLLAGELCLRVAARGFTPSALARWGEPPSWSAIKTTSAIGLAHPVPGGLATWPLQPWDAPIEYRLDGLGFRVQTDVAPRQSRGCRVLAVGDSHTFGYGVAAGAAWPARLEGLLDHSGHPASVVNAGICGVDLAAERAWLTEVLDRVDPDVVVLGTTPWSLRVEGGPPESDRFGDRLWRRLDAPLRRAAGHSALVDRGRRLVVHGLTALLGWPPPGAVFDELTPLLEPEPAFASRWASVDAVLADMVVSIRRRGAQPLLVFVPLDLQLSQARNRLYKAEGLPYPSNGFVDRDYTRDDRYRRAIAAEETALGISVVDATEALAPDVEHSFLGDDYHLSAAGHRRVAEVLLPAVRDLCTGRGGSSPATMRYAGSSSRRSAVSTGE